MLVGRHCRNNPSHNVRPLRGFSAGDELDSDYNTLLLSFSVSTVVGQDGLDFFS
jgi:hypothetical protein